MEPKIASYPVASTHSPGLPVFIGAQVQPYSRPLFVRASFPITSVLITQHPLSVIGARSLSLLLRYYIFYYKNVEVHCDVTVLIGGVWR